MKYRRSVLELFSIHAINVLNQVPDNSCNYYFVVHWQCHSELTRSTSLSTRHPCQHQVQGYACTCTCHNISHKNFNVHPQWISKLLVSVRAFPHNIIIYGVRHPMWPESGKN